MQKLSSLIEILGFTFELYRVEYFNDQLLFEINISYIFERGEGMGDGTRKEMALGTTQYLNMVKSHGFDKNSNFITFQIKEIFQNPLHHRSNSKC